MRDIKGFEGLYAITSCGKVWSYKHKKFLKPNTVNGGYLIYRLYKDKKCYSILAHRLVAESYIPNPDNLEQVNHKDEIKTNNSINNLEWCSRKYNMNYGTARERANKKLFKQVRCIETGQIFESFKLAEKELGLKKGTVANFFNRGKSYCGYTFEKL